MLDSLPVSELGQWTQRVITISNPKSDGGIIDKIARLYPSVSPKILRAGVLIGSLSRLLWLSHAITGTTNRFWFSIVS
jgi:hypothetical protein